MTKTYIQLKQDIEAELRWDPRINAAQIGVSVDKEVVSLLGGVDTYAERWAAEGAFKWDVFVPKTVAATVREGSVTLTREVTWNYQRDAAEHAIRHLTGVVAVYNSITLKPQAAVDQVKEKVEAALLRQARSDAKSIHIETSGGKVTLTGHASSWQSMQDAAGAAWAAPGVTEVVDKISIAN
jgi:osmotically-inducible protein OsmY